MSASAWLESVFKWATGSFGEYRLISDFQTVSIFPSAL